MKIATLGPQGTYSEEAARYYHRLHYADEPLEIVFTTVNRSLWLVQNRQADLAIVPVENMIDGLIGSTFDALIEYQDFVKVCDEIHLPIAHVLATKPETDWKRIKKILSHPSPLNQCQNRLEQMFPEAELIPVLSTAEATETVLKDDTDSSAAICNRSNAESKKMKIFEGQIQDYAVNETRFLVCALQDGVVTGNDLTLMVVRYGTNQPGQLFQTTKHLADAGVDLTFVQSRPYKIKPQDYLLIFEFIGHKSDHHVEQALKNIELQVRQSDGWKKILGSFPRRERINHHGD